MDIIEKLDVYSLYSNMLSVSVYKLIKTTLNSAWIYFKATFLFWNYKLSAKILHTYAYKW